VVAAGTAGAWKTALPAIAKDMPGWPGTGVMTGSLLGESSKVADIGFADPAGAVLLSSIVKPSSAGAA